MVYTHKPSIMYTRRVYLFLLVLLLFFLSLDPRVSPVQFPKREEFNGNFFATAYGATLGPLYHYTLARVSPAWSPPARGLPRWKGTETLGCYYYFLFFSFFFFRGIHNVGCPRGPDAVVLYARR